MISLLMDVANIATSVIAVCSLIAAVTPTPKDDVWISKAYKFLEVLALNIGKAKQQEKTTMGKNEKTPITVEDQEYFVEDLNEQQRLMVNHITDLDRKISNARFNLDQLAFGREAFVNALAQSLKQVDSEADAETDGKSLQ